LKLVDIQKMIDIEQITREMMEEDKNDLLQELEDHCELKHKGARATNLSTAQDMRFTMQCLSQEVCL